MVAVIYLIECDLINSVGLFINNNKAQGQEYVGTLPHGNSGLY